MVDRNLYTLRRVPGPLGSSFIVIYIQKCFIEEKKKIFSQLNKKPHVERKETLLVSDSRKYVFDLRGEKSRAKFLALQTFYVHVWRKVRLFIP